MKNLIFVKKFPHKEVIVYTPKSEILGRLIFNQVLRKIVWEQTTNKFLTFKRMKEIVDYRHEELITWE